MRLYFDIGNTNIKLNFKVNGEEFLVAYKTTENYTVDSFYTYLPQEVKDAKIRSVSVVSVVPSKLELIKGLSKKYWQIDPMVLSFPLKTGINIKALDPKKVGADLVSLSAFVASKTKNGIIVNMGTATTITHIKDNELKGVIILPGLKTSLNALLKNAAKLSEIDLYLPKNKNVGNTTDEAISIGLIKGHALMIKGLIKDIDKDAQIFLSGGNSRMLKDYLFEYQYIKEATLEGLKVVEALNEK